MTKQTSTLARMLIVGCAGVACAATVPVPKVTAIPVTANSFPALANSRNLGPLDLAKAGYVEEEFLVSGTANVYDWAARVMQSIGQVGAAESGWPEEEPWTKAAGL